MGGASAHNGDEAGDVDDAPSGLKPLGRIGLVCTHRQDGILRPVPNALHVDTHCEVPKMLSSKSQLRFGW